MPKQVYDAALDAAYALIDDCTTIRVLSTYALDDSHATVVTNTLASTTMTAGMGGVDYAAAADGAGGAGSRKLVISAKSGVSVTGAGTQNATHVALTLTGDTTVRMVTTCTSQPVTNGNTVNIPSWQHDFTVPT
jgi:hypothetical protein